MTVASPLQSDTLKSLRKVFHGWLRASQKQTSVSIHGPGTECLRLPPKNHNAAWDVFSGFSLFKQHDDCFCFFLRCYSKRKIASKWLVSPFQNNTTMH